MSWFLAVIILILITWINSSGKLKDFFTKNNLASASFLIVSIITAFYVIVFPIYYFLNNDIFTENPKICIDNYSAYEVDIYIDGEIWKKNVPPSYNLSFNSLSNEFYELEEGNHSFEIYASGNQIKNLQEISYSVFDDGKYILNVLDKVTYEDGYVAYGSGSSDSEKHKKTFFDLKKDYYDYTFEYPPKSAYVRKSRSGNISGNYRRFIVRENFSKVKTNAEKKYWKQANSQDIGSDSLKEAYKYLPIPKEQADSMGILLVQTYDGRIEPTHTLAYDIFHKISKENDFTTSDNISVNPMQIFIDMILDKPYWLEEKIIYIKKGTGVADSLGIEGKYASVRDFFNPDGTEKLKELVQLSFAKKDVEKNVFDKEVIKANERMNIVLQTMNGAFLKIFPIAGSIDNKWVDWMDPYAEQPIDTTDQHLANISLSRLFRSYIIDLGEAKKTNNYETAQSLLNFIKAYQIKTAPAKLLLNKNQIEREISYNHSNLFVTVKNYYGYLSVLLLIFSFWNALSKKKNLINKIVKYILWGLIVLLMVVFGMHTYALALRWYITEHAPWSNGYEALTFIAWGGVLAGFLFIRSSRITLAGTALLAFCVLMTAGHSSFDPQLTDLQPVLKSYWLVIHVACITISYGFLGLGFILGLINVVNYIFLKPKNKNLKMIISELTYVNEMTLTIGLALATIGTFLGGIWANESWGRYWGWDAKETWALVIVLTYAIILHFRLIPGLKSKFTFNVASVLAFSSVLMTFIGVNYYLSKGLHSYARGETPVFPIWAWITIASIFGLILLGWYNKKKLNKST